MFAFRAKANFFVFILATHMDNELKCEFLSTFFLWQCNIKCVNVLLKWCEMSQAIIWIVCENDFEYFGVDFGNERIEVT